MSFSLKTCLRSRGWKSWTLGAAPSAAVLLAALQASPAHAVVVVNEVLGSTSGSDWEYIELFNTGASSVNISGWKLELWDSDAGGVFGGADGGSPFVIPSTTLLGSGGHYLLANSLAQTGFGITANQTLPDNAVENSSYTVVLVDSANTVRDAVLVIDSASESGNANRAGASITPSGVVGPDGGFLPAGFRRSTDGGSSFQILPFNTSVLGNSSDPANLATPANDGVDFLPASSNVPIYDIQGNGAASALLGTQVVTSGVVTRVNDNGFFMQDAAGDGDAATSDGIFVFTNAAPTVAVGDALTVTGVVDESAGRTQVGGSLTVTKTGVGNVNPTVVQFPVASAATLESLEGMLVHVEQPADQPLRMTEYFNLDRFGEIRLSPVLFNQFTEDNAPSVAGYADHVANVALHTITLDDGRSVQNPHPAPLVGDPVANPGTPIEVIRRGDIFENIVGVLDSGPGGFNIDPTVDPVITSVNPRPTAVPEVGGRLKVASMNVLNYFNGDGAGAGFPTSRGAFDAAEFAVQSDKLTDAIRGSGAHIVGLQEMENDLNTSLPAMQSLVDALNAKATGGETWAYVNTGKVGTDEITVGFIYRSDVVAPDGAFATLDVTGDPRFFTGLNGNRPALAQTFVELASGEKITLVNNHLKSKGGSGTGLDADQGDGQGAWNSRRTLAALALLDWISADPTGAGDPDYLLLGDFNAYFMEDPVQALIAGGLTELMKSLVGPQASSYVFDGQAGSLDHLFATSTLMSQIIGVAGWTINADEPDLYDYVTRFGKHPGYTADGFYRTSDHDPIIVGLNLGPAGQPVPEPAGISLLALASGALLLGRRRRNRA